MSDKPRAYKLTFDGILPAEARKVMHETWRAQWERVGVVPPPLFLCQRGYDIVPLDPADEKPAGNIPEPIAVKFREFL